MNATDAMEFDEDRVLVSRLVCRVVFDGGGAGLEESRSRGDRFGNSVGLGVHSRRVSTYSMLKIDLSRNCQTARLPYITRS